jgi:hypothetical protein
MGKRPPRTRDSKDIMIAGCAVRLSYGTTAGNRWTVRATLRCGIGEKAEEQSIVTAPCEDRDRAERDALQRITALLGQQTDRSHSRVRNWT